MVIINAMPYTEPAASLVALVAYLRDADNNTDDAVQWRLETNPDVILGWPHDDMLCGRFTDSQAVHRAFQLQFPPSDSRLRHTTCYNPGFSSLPRWMRVHSHEWYDGLDYDVVADLAQLRGVIPVSQVGFWENSQWDHKLRRHVKRNRQLWERGCYLRDAKKEREVAHSEIVYNPKVTARRLYKAAHAKPGSTHATYIRISELTDVAVEMDKKCVEVVNMDLLGVTRWDSALQSRRGVVEYFHRVLVLFEMLFGPRAYWQLESFQKLMQEWKTRGERSRKVFDKYSERHITGKLFKLFDVECTSRRPRKRVLKSRLPQYMLDRHDCLRDLAARR